MAEDNNGWSAFYYSHNKDKKEMKIWFDRGALLGRGGYGVVFKGKFGGREVAVKRVELYRVKEREEEAMLKLDHPNIVKLLHCESDDDYRNYALEICDASLDKLFLKSDDPKKYNGPMPLNIEIFHQLAVGLAYIHSENLIHRDIKPENILISVRSTGQGNEVTIKWADFGLSKPVNERGTYTLTEFRGTINWLAPESLKWLTNPQPGVESRGTVKSDVFVLGLVYGYLFLKGQHLYGNESDIYQNIVNKKDPVNMHNIDEKLRQVYEKDLLRKMLEDDPQKRITSKVVVEQLKFINEKFTEKEEELRRLCERDSSSGLIEKINDLIQLGKDVNGGWNALHHLCQFNSNLNVIDVIRILIQLRIDVNAKVNDGWNALHLLCANGWNALHCLCANNSDSHLINVIRSLVQLGIENVNAKDNYGRNALHCLCRYNSNSNLIDAIRLLIQLGIDVKAKDKYGRNALHYLCRNVSNSNLINAIELLIQLGIDVNAKSNDGRNALHYLCWNNSNPNLIDAIRLIIQLGIDVNAKSNAGWNALHFLCKNNSISNLIDAIQLLIQLGIDFNAKDNDGRNALHYLCWFNSNSNLIDAVRLLIQLGIDVNAKDDDGWNALHYLCWNNSNSNLIDAIQLLIQLGIDVNAKNIYRENALHRLCENNSSANLIEAIRLLIQRGIDVVSDDHDARSILRENYRIKNKEEILKVLDEAARV